MADTYARFAASPIGPLLAVRDGGLTLTTTDQANIARAARSDIAVSSGAAGVEFAVWGDDDMAAFVGLLTPDAPLVSYPGGAPGGVGWHLPTGRLFRDGVPLAAGLPLVAKGDIVGIRVTFGQVAVMSLYLNGQLVHSGDVGLGGALHFGATVAGTKAGGLCMAVNAGQWAADSPAAAAGWRVAASTGSARVADVDWLTAPGDAPAHARYEGLLAEGLNLVSEIGWWPWGGEAVSQTTAAECTVLDADGLLDDLALRGASGLQVRIRTAPAAGMLADATDVVRLTVDHVEINDDGSKTIHFRDAHDYLDGTINRGVFLPNVPALAWKPQPVVIGAVASVPAMGANSDATALFVSDRRVYLDAVMDRGDLMEPGTFDLAPDGQQLLMKSPPVLPVVADASSIGAGQTPATLQQAVADIMARLGQGAWSSADCAAIDAATGYAGVGYYAGTAITGRDALSAILPSFGAGCYQAPDGVLRFAQVVAPETYAGALAFDLADGDPAEDLVVVPDDAPNLTRRMGYRPNAQALGASDLVTDLVDVPQARRDELTSLFRGQVYGGGQLHQHYRRAEAADPVISLFWSQSDAQAEIDRVVQIYQRQRFFYRATFRGRPDLAPLPGQVGRIAYGRYGLQEGKQVLVRRIERNPTTGDVVLTMWG